MKNISHNIHSSMPFTGCVIFLSLTPICSAVLRFFSINSAMLNIIYSTGISVLALMLYFMINS